MAQQLFKIPQNPYDGDTFAITLLPNDEMNFGLTTSSCAINNEQPENSNTKVLYDGKLWGRNEIIPLSYEGHCNVGGGGQTVVYKTVKRIIYETVLEPYEVTIYEDVPVQVWVPPVVIPGEGAILSIYMMLDTSGSMAGSRIASLNAGVKYFFDTMHEKYPQHLDKIWLSICAMGGGMHSETRRTPMSQYPWRYYEDESGAGLNEAILWTINMIKTDEGLKTEDEKRRSLPPLVLFITDATDIVAQATFNKWNDEIKPVVGKILASGINSQYPTYIYNIAKNIEDTLYIYNDPLPYIVFFDRGVNIAVDSFDTGITVPGYWETVIEQHPRVVTRWREVQKEREIEEIVEEIVNTGKIQSNRMEQYFTYVKAIDTWVCYWQMTPVFKTSTTHQP